MSRLKYKFTPKTVCIAAFAIFSLVYTVTAFSQENVPNTARGVLGRGYDLSGSYAEPLEIKRQVLNLDRLIADNRVERNYNIERASFTTVTGRNISEYTRNLAIGNSLTIGAGASILSFSASFSHEASNRFGSERVSRQEYEFATRSSNITKGAFHIEDGNLTRYVNDSFINDVKTMTPEQIIGRYGTHVMLGALLGARLDYNMSVRRTRQTGSTTINNLVETSFDARFRGIGGGVNNTRELESRFGQEFDISSMNAQTKVFGGRSEFAQAIHNNQDYDAWIASIEGREVWIGYYPGSLVQLDDLIVQELFGARTQALKDALRNAIYSHFGPPLPTPVPGTTIASQLAWLRTNAVSGTNYIIEVSGNVTITPQVLTPPTGRTNVTVILRGIGAMRTVSLLADGHLFNVDSGVTLVLDNNITLQGRNQNFSLMLVENGGTLIMNEGSIITGNTNASGVFINTGGTFVMYGGTISQNIGSKPVFALDTASAGGVYNKGTFTMYDGIISNNRGGSGDFSPFPGAAGGAGGVNNSGIFTMHGGAISSNNGGRGQDSVGIFDDIKGRGGDGGAGGVHNSNGSSFFRLGGSISGNSGGSGGSGGRGGVNGSRGIDNVAR